MAGGGTTSGARGALKVSAPEGERREGEKHRKKERVDAESSEGGGKTKGAAQSSKGNQGVGLSGKNETGKKKRKNAPAKGVRGPWWTNTRQ